MNSLPLFSEKTISIEFLQDIFETTNSGFFAKNTNGKIISLNKFMLSVYGVETKDEVFGKRDFDFFPQHIAAAITQDDESVLQTRRPIIDKIEMVPFSDFKIHWLKTSKYPIYGDNDEVTGLIGVTSKLEESSGYAFKSEKMATVLNYMERRINEKISLDELCNVAFMSKTSLLRHFKDTFEISPMAYLKRVRMHLACKMLRNTDNSLATIATACGYYDQSHFNKDFKSLLNTTPKKYKTEFGKFRE